MRDTGYIVVLITASSPQEAQTIAEALLERREAACVNTTAVQSLFTWQGKCENAQEILLIVKTRAALFSQVQTTVKSLHSYTVPEIIALPIIAGHQPYLDWVDENTGESSA
ncbi:MAG: divalent-cation tolerance protein CutA [Candidatus Omnitrophica bacterium]|nr:divalent-cation tolerance protein CutA [Candidatus Omnitrophota bacterium]